MGITISGKRKEVGCSIDIPFLSFTNIKIMIANCIDKQFGELYSNLQLDAVDEDISDYEYQEKVKTIERYINKNNLVISNAYSRVFDFLFMPDEAGSITYGTCRSIYNIIANTDDTKLIGYPGWGKDCATIKDFKNLLLECYKAKSKLVWD